MQIDPARLVAARLARAMSQEEAAIATDLSARTIQRIEAGHPASLESTKALLTVFGAGIIHDPDADAAAVPQSPWRQIGTQLAAAARRSASFSFDGLRLLLVAVFMLTAVSKPFMPDRTGLYLESDGVSLGVMRQAPAGVPDMLGYWIMPLMLLAAVAMALTIGRVRRLVQPLR